jgi:hypothetical protein
MRLVLHPVQPNFVCKNKRLVGSQSQCAHVNTDTPAERGLWLQQSRYAP